MNRKKTLKKEKSIKKALQGRTKQYKGMMNWMQVAAVLKKSEEQRTHCNLTGNIRDVLFFFLKLYLGI